MVCSVVRYVVHADVYHCPPEDGYVHVITNPTVARMMHSLDAVLAGRYSTSSAGETFPATVYAMQSCKTIVTS